MTDAVAPPLRAAAATSSATRRLSLITVDQALSSASNLLVLLLAAHALSAIDFGRFGLIMLIYTFALGPTHACVSVPVVIHPEDADHRRWDVLGSALVLSVWGGVLCAGVGGLLFLSHSVMAAPILALGLLLPLLQFQDVGRNFAFARAQPARAITLDTIWLVLMLGAIVGIHVVGQVSLFTFMLAWGGTGGIAGLWMFVQYGPPRRGHMSLAWVRERWPFSWRSLVSELTHSGGALIGAGMITFVSSALGVAAVRAALLLGRPSGALQAAVATSVAADVAREVPDDHGLRRQQRRAMSISTVVALVNLTILILLPGWLGRALLGNVWPVISSLMLAVGLSVVAMAAQSGVRAVLLGRRQMGTTMVVDIIGAVVLIVSVIVGAKLSGATGAVWSLVVGNGVTGLCWWIAFVRYLRRDRRRGPGRHRLS